VRHALAMLISGAARRRRSLAGGWNRTYLSIDVSSSGIPSPDFAEIHSAPFLRGAAPGRNVGALLHPQEDDRLSRERRTAQPRIAVTDANRCLSCF